MKEVNIIITGPTGSGKTAVASIIEEALSKYSKSISFRKAPDETDDLVKEHAKDIIREVSIVIEERRTVLDISDRF